MPAADEASRQFMGMHRYSLRVFLECLRAMGFANNQVGSIPCGFTDDCVHQFPQNRIASIAFRLYVLLRKFGRS